MFKPRIIVRAVAAATTISTAGGLAHGAVLEETIVTAQKREQSVQDVGISVSALSGDQLQALGITNTVEITEQVPGLAMVAFSPNLTVFNIRGVSQNNFTDNLEAPVAVYVDDVYMASMNGINAQMFDMQRVEVLRGPQGTLFGRNATGGVIQYITNGANDEELNGYIEGNYGNYDRQEVEGAVGFSVTDSIRARFAGRSAEVDGYMKSKNFPEFGPDGNPPGLEPSGVDIGGTDGYAWRTEWQFDLTDKLLMTLQYKGTKDNKVPTGGYNFLPYGNAADAYIPPEFQQFTQDVILEGGDPPGGLTLEQFTADVFFCPSQLDCFAPVDEAGRTIYEGDATKPFEHYSDYAGYLDRNTDSTTARFDWELSDSMNLVSITNYFTLDKYYTEDGDGIPVPIIEFTTVADYTQFSQELRLSGERDKFRWVVGGYYLDMETDAKVATGGAPTASVAVDLGYDPDELTDPAVLQKYQLDSTNWSVFGQGEWDFSEAFTAIVGLRWSQDDKEMDFRTSFESPADGILVPDLFDLKAAARAAGNDKDKVDYGDWAGRFELDWKIDADTLAYASYNRGIKGGNFAPSANVGLDNIRHDEEKLDAYEIGLKTQFLDGKARLNSAVFYYDYPGYQAFTFQDGTPSIANADAKNQGAEIELTYLPNEHWDLSLGASYQDSEVDHVETPQQQVTPVGFEVDWPIDYLNGNDLPNTPTYSFNYLARYNLDMLGGNVALQLDGVFYDDQYLEVSNAAGALQESYSVHNARLSWWSAEQTVRVSVWVKNYTDEEYKNYALDLGILGATTTYGSPITYGLTAGYYF